MCVIVPMYCRQDTNGLALHTLAPVLGVSTAREFEVNSMAIPRKAKQAIGGITTLTREDGKQMTVGQLSPKRGDFWNCSSHPSYEVYIHLLDLINLAVGL